MKKSVKLWHLLVLYTFAALLTDVAVHALLKKNYHYRQELLVTQALEKVRGRFEEKVNTNLLIIYGMAAYLNVHQEIEDQEFNALSAAFLKQSRSLLNVAIAPDFVVQKIYPFKGNEKLIGLDYRKKPGWWEAASHSMEKGHMEIEGPISLVQGRTGLVGRVPVFKNGTKVFWGMISSTMDFDKLLEQAGIKHFQEKGLDVAIRKKGNAFTDKDFLWGEKSLFDLGTDAISMAIALPSGNWQMAARPVDGWAKKYPNMHLFHLMISAVLLVVLMVVRNSHQSRMALVESENRLKSMSDASHDALIMIDSSGRVTFWNPAAEKMFGYTRDEIIGQDMHRLLTLPSDRKLSKKGMRSFAKSGQGPVINSVIEMQAIRKSGEVFPVERSVAPFQIKNRWFAVGSVRDITKRKETETRLLEMATTDSLTGIPNRRHYMEQSQKQVQLAARYKKPFCLVMFDLDHFKQINDTYGHDVGDFVLKTVAACMKKTLRDTDIIGRIGGEEFAVSMPETSMETAKDVVMRLKDALGASRLKTECGDLLRFTASFGMSKLSHGSDSVETLLKQADMALYKAKEKGRNCIVLS